MKEKKNTTARRIKLHFVLIFDRDWLWLAFLRRSSFANGLWWAAQSKLHSGRSQLVTMLTRNTRRLWEGVVGYSQEGK